MRFQPGNTVGKGRPPGSKNKTPDRATLIQLLDEITKDLLTNYSKLKTSEKIRLLHAFNGLYQDSIIQALQDTLNDLGEGSVIRFEFGSDEDDTYQITQA